MSKKIPTDPIVVREIHHFPRAYGDELWVQLVTEDGGYIVPRELYEDGLVTGHFRYPNEEDLRE